MIFLFVCYKPIGKISDTISLQFIIVINSFQHLNACCGQKTDISKTKQTLRRRQAEKFPQQKKKANHLKHR